MKIIIIGSGLLGLTSAYYLARHDHEVTVVERRDGVALETSFANATLLTPSLSAPWISLAQVRAMLNSLFGQQRALRMNMRALPELVRWGLRTLPYLGKEHFKKGLLANLRMNEYNLELLRRLQNDITELDYDHGNSGNLMIFRRQESIREAQQQERALSELGIKHEVLEPEAIAFKEPALATVAGQLAGAVYHANDEHGDPHKFCLSLEKQCRSLGVQFLFGSDVTRLQRKNGRLEGIEIQDESVQADAFVLAAGSASAALAKAVGLAVPVYPVKGYSITLDMDVCEPKPSVPVLDGDDHIALVPLGNRLRVTGFAELAGFDSTIYQNRIDILKHQVARIFPEQSARLLSGDLDSWSGFRPLSCDGVPLVGPTVLNNVYLNTGHGTLGWSMAAASGKALADLMSGLKPEIDLSPYSPMRFV